eukprot:gene25976-11661_t
MFKNFFSSPIAANGQTDKGFVQSQVQQLDIAVMKMVMVSQHDGGERRGSIERRGSTERPLGSRVEVVAEDEHKRRNLQKQQSLASQGSRRVTKGGIPQQQEAAVGIVVRMDLALKAARDARRELLDLEDELLDSQKAGRNTQWLVAYWSFIASFGISACLAEASTLLVTACISHRLHWARVPSVCFTALWMGLVLFGTYSCFLNFERKAQQAGDWTAGGGTGVTADEKRVFRLNIAGSFSLMILLSVLAFFTYFGYILEWAIAPTLAIAVFVTVSVFCAQLMTFGYVCSEAERTAMAKPFKGFPPPPTQKVLLYADPPFLASPTTGPMRTGPPSDMVLPHVDKPSSHFSNPLWSASRSDMVLPHADKPSPHLKTPLSSASRSDMALTHADKPSPHFKIPLSSASRSDMAIPHVDKPPPHFKIPLSSASLSDMSIPHAYDPMPRVQLEDPICWPGPPSQAFPPRPSLPGTAYLPGPPS